MIKQKPVLILTYTDPEKKFVKIFKKNIDLLKNIFSGVCVSVSYDTVKNNNKFLHFLENKGCFVFRNSKNTSIGDHFRNGLKIYQANFNNADAFCFCEDRMLFALEAEYKDIFIKDATKNYNEDFVIFARSKKAWASHSRDYQILENMVAEEGIKLTGKKIDWLWCGALLKNKLVNYILKESNCDSVSVITEWVLIAYRSGATIKNKEVDWLGWEDPFWAKKKGIALSKKMDIQKKLYRLGYCADSLKLFLK